MTDLGLMTNYRKKHGGKFGNANYYSYLRNY